MRIGRLVFGPIRILGPARVQTPWIVLRAFLGVYVGLVKKR